MIICSFNFGSFFFFSISLAEEEVSVLRQRTWHKQPCVLLHQIPSKDHAILFGWAGGFFFFPPIARNIFSPSLREVTKKIIVLIIVSFRVVSYRVVSSKMQSLAISKPNGTIGLNTFFMSTKLPLSVTMEEYLKFKSLIHKQLSSANWITRLLINFSTIELHHMLQLYH